MYVYIYIYTYHYWRDQEPLHPNKCVLVRRPAALGIKLKNLMMSVQACQSNNQCIQPNTHSGNRWLVRLTGEAAQ